MSNYKKWLINKNKMLKNILDVFTYETLDIIKNVKYYNCTFLKTLSEYKKGVKVSSICINLELLIWNNDVLIENDSITI